MSRYQPTDAHSPLEGTLEYDPKYEAEDEELFEVKQGGSKHTYSSEEVSAYAQHLNNTLGRDEDLAHLMPIHTDAKTFDLFEKIEDGTILAKFVNCIQPDAIDLRVLNYPNEYDGPKTPAAELSYSGATISTFQVHENLNLVINSAKAIGVRVIGVGAKDIIDAEKNPTLALGLLWQMVKMHLCSNINLKACPELLRLLRTDEELSDLLSLSPQQILRRWLNYHLEQAGHARRVKNFSGDMIDSEVYTIVMHQIQPKHCDTSALDIDSYDKGQRAKKVLENARRMGMKPFIRPEDIVSGNEKLNLAFTADLFNHCTGLAPLDTEESKDYIGLMDFTGDCKEERLYRYWINSLGNSELYLDGLYDGLSDGVQLLRVIDTIEPGSVNWRKVDLNPTMVFKKNINNNYAIVLGKAMKFVLVNIGGSDITRKKKNLVLGFIWQLFRYHCVKFLKNMSARKVTDEMILDWCNKQVQAQGGKPVSSFGDKSLASGLWCIYLAKAINPERVDSSYVTAGETEEQQILNAKYAISVTRAQDCHSFLLPEHIQQVNRKFILTFAASVMKRKQTKAGY